MTVQASDANQAASCHQTASSASQKATGTHATATTSARFVAALVALPRPVKIVGGAVLVFVALLAVGVPLATLTPLLALGGCLGMHLFMPGMHGGHGGHDEHGSHAATESADTPAQADRRPS